MRISHLILTVCLVARMAAYTLNTGSRTGTADGTYSDVTNLVKTVLARNESNWILTLGAAGTTSTWNMASCAPVEVFTTNRITLKGAGTDTNNLWTINSTGLAQGFSLANAVAEFGPGVRSENPIQLSYIKFTTTGSAGIPVLIRRGVGKRGFRIDHCTFDGVFPDRHILTGYGDNANGGPGPYGLIDHCYFNTTGTHESVLVGVGNDAHNYDTNPQSFGTEEVVAIEDCFFRKVGATAVGVPAIDTSRDGRLLVRRDGFNNWTIVIHGYDSDAHSGQQYEILDNRFTFSDVSGITYNIFMRGGTGYIRGNSFTNTAAPNVVFWMVHYKACSGSPVGQQCFAYPCDEQIGRGVVGGAPGLVPLYYYNNSLNGGTATIQNGFCGQDATWIQDGRDYYSNTQKPGYTELSYPHPLISVTLGTNAPVVVNGRVGLRGVNLRSTL